MWSPRATQWLAAALALRLLCARWSAPDDCDEVYNYWEPVHLLLYGTGMQTWEYSPLFGLRSYWYPGALALLAQPVQWLVGRDGVLVWYALRAALALGCALCEATLYGAVRRRWGDKGSALPAVFGAALLLSPGMFAASASLLPNSLSMCLYMVSFAFWIDERRGPAVAVGAASVLLGVPFSVVLLLPMALHVVWVDGLRRTLPWALGATVMSLLPQLIIDRLLYRRWVFAVLNIVFYNALSGETDSTLYGVEPWSFYAKNLVLNLNVMAVLALAALPIVLLARRWFRAVVLASPLLWLALMMYLPHKEQRFLYPIYPLLLLAGAVALAEVYALLRRGSAVLGAVFLAAVLAALLLAGASRVAAQVQYRSGPTEVWRGVQHVRNATICMGDDWYRFPSSFWLPDASVKLRFVASGFHGLLPKEFAPWPDATYAIPSGMNGHNREVLDERIVPLSQCDYLVREEPTADELPRVVSSARLVDDSRSRPLFRAFWVPDWLRPAHAVSFKKFAIVKMQRQ